MKELKEEKKTIKISSFEPFDDEANLFPRIEIDVFTVQRYKDAMATGSLFPPIKVALFKGKYYIVDGVHRTEAVKLLGWSDEIVAYVGKYDSLDEIFLESVRLNSKHGKAFSSADRTRIVDILKSKKIAVEEISKIVQISVNDVKKTSMVSDTFKRTITGKEVDFQETKHLPTMVIGELAPEGVRHSYIKTSPDRAWAEDLAPLKEAIKFLKKYKLSLEFKEQLDVAMELKERLDKELRKHLL